MRNTTQFQYLVEHTIIYTYHMYIVFLYSEKGNTSNKFWNHTFINYFLGHFRNVCRYKFLRVYSIKCKFYEWRYLVKLILFEIWPFINKFYLISTSVPLTRITIRHLGWVLYKALVFSPTELFTMSTMSSMRVYVFNASAILISLFIYLGGWGSFLWCWEDHRNFIFFLNYFGWH